MEAVSRRVGACLVILQIFFSPVSLCAGSPVADPSPCLESVEASWIGLKGSILERAHIVPPSHVADITNAVGIDGQLLDFQRYSDSYRQSELFEVSSAHNPSIKDSMRDMRIATHELEAALREGRPNTELVRIVFRIDTCLEQLICANYAFSKSVNRGYMDVMYLFLAMILFILVFFIFFRARMRKAQMKEANSTVFVHSVIRAHEEERRKLARELHDTVVQDITGIKLKTEALYYEIARHSKKYNVEFDGLVLEERRCIERIRRVCYDLRPPELDYLDLRASLSELCGQFGSWTEIDYTLDCEDGIVLTDREKINAYRIIQELLANVRKHSGATRARVAVSLVDGTGVRIIVSDNGHGIDASFFKNLREIRSRHFGLRGIQERVDILGGTMRIDCPPEGGTAVCIDFPLTDAKARASIKPSEMRRDRKNGDQHEKGKDDRHHRRSSDHQGRLEASPRE